MAKPILAAVAAPNLNASVVLAGQLDDVRTRLEAAAGPTGYQLVEPGYNSFQLSRRRIPAWAIVLAVLFFPFGLVFLVARTVDVVLVTLERAASGTQVRLEGRASPALRRALDGALGEFRVAGAPAPRWPAAAPEAGVYVEPARAPAPSEPVAAAAAAAGAPVPTDPAADRGPAGTAPTVSNASAADPPPTAAPPAPVPPSAAPPPPTGPPPPAGSPPPTGPPPPPPFGGTPGGLPPMPLGPIGGSYPPPAPPPGGPFPGT